MKDDILILGGKSFTNRLLTGTGKFMRHVKLRPETDVDAAVLTKLIETAYVDMKARIEKGG